MKPTSGLMSDVRPADLSCHTARARAVDYRGDGGDFVNSIFAGATTARGEAGAAAVLSTTNQSSCRRVRAYLPASHQMNGGS